jgi:DNA helicase-2/ATP-dependent DNA helicase PcrA
MTTPEPEWPLENWELLDPPDAGAFEEPFGPPEEQVAPAPEPPPGEKPVEARAVTASYVGEDATSPANSLLDLNLEQLEAVDTRGPVVLVAPPGSGKTRTLAGRVCRILQNASPQSVLALTFTRYATSEMREEIRNVVGDGADEANITTLHALGLGLVRGEADRLGLTRHVGVASPSYARHLIGKVIETCGLDSRWDLDDLAREIERAKGQAIGPDEYRVFPGDFYSQTVSRIYHEYQKTLREKNLVDFGDMLRLAVEALRANPEARSFYQHLYRYVLVDEWQDTNSAQYQLIRMLVGRETDLFVVGDPLQSIYGWRGADPAVFQAVARDYPGVRDLQLRVNYRNSETIAQASEGIVKALGLSPRNMATQGDAGEPLTVVRCDTERDEALRVAEEVKRLAEAGEYDYNEFAVLVRTVRQARLIEQAFLQNRVPYELAGHRSFFKIRAVRELLAWFRLAADPFDEGAIETALNAPPRGLGRVTRQKLRAGAFRLTMESLLGVAGRQDLQQRAREGVAQFLRIVDDVHAERERPLPALLDYVLERTGYAAWLRKAVDGSGNGNGSGENGEVLIDFPAAVEGDAILKLRLILEGFHGEKALERFLDKLEEMQMQPESTAGVLLGTIHASKGLEWPVVFLPGLDEGLLPHARSLLDKRRLEEEHRLFYVALTRAMRQVYLLSAQYRTNVRGQVWECRPSRFLSYLPHGALRRG